MGHENYDREDSGEGGSNRSFGIVFAVAFALFGLLPLAVGGRVRAWALVLGAVSAISAAVWPAVLAPLNRFWLQVGRLMHRVVSPIVLGIMFFGVITPIGLAMRAFGKDPLRRHFDKSLGSYWIERVPPGPSPESLQDQF